MSTFTQVQLLRYLYLYLSISIYATFQREILYFLLYLFDNFSYFSDEFWFDTMDNIQHIVKYCTSGFKPFRISTFWSCSV